MGSPSAMVELLPFRQDGDNGGPWPVSYSGEALETHRRAALRIARGLWSGGKSGVPPLGRACSGVILISIKKAALAAPGSAR
jgi:hypothetical protein